jgi:hypothetical protein
MRQPALGPNVIGKVVCPQLSRGDAFESRADHLTKDSLFDQWICQNTKNHQYAKPNQPPFGFACESTLTWRAHIAQRSA